MAKIVDEQGNEVEGETVGELAVKGPGVMLCYYKNPEATAEVLKDGWLYTGDMAKRDADGFIYLVDRKKDVIITGGENLYPVQIEDFLRANDKIKDVAVIGLPDARLGEIAAAIIELKDGVEATEDEINEFCKGCRAISARERFFLTRSRGIRPAKSKSRSCASAIVPSASSNRRRPSKNQRELRNL